MIVNYIVYMHTNIINSKKYIGITSVDIYSRWRGGRGYDHNPHFSAAIKKYGWDNFIHEILEKNLSRDRAEEMERYYISEYKTTNPDIGYNLSSGGGLGVSKFSKETLQRMSEGNLGEKNPMFGKKHSKETRNIISNALKNNSNTSKKVQCIETGEIFLSTRDVERKLGLNHSGISAACSGRQKTCGKYHWQYYNKEEV